MQMSDEEIRRNYRAAANKQLQIGILADLNLCSKEKIKRILEQEEAPEPVPEDKPPVIDSEKYMAAGLRKKKKDADEKRRVSEVVKEAIVKRMVEVQEEIDALMEKRKELEKKLMELNTFIQEQ